MNFSSKLFNWYQKNKRELPWRETKDPYKIWISEVILQQTRVKQGLPYYIKFLNEYPSLKMENYRIPKEFNFKEKNKYMIYAHFGNFIGLQ